MKIKAQQNFWDTLKAVVGVKCIALHIHKNEKKHKKINDLKLQFKNLRKQEQNKLKHC